VPPPRSAVMKQAGRQYRPRCHRPEVVRTNHCPPRYPETLLCPKPSPPRRRCRESDERTEYSWDASCRRGAVYAGYMPRSRSGSELAFVRDKAERGLRCSVFGPVGAKVDFQIDDVPEGQVTVPGLSQAFDGSGPILGGHHVRHELEVVPDRAFHPPRYHPTKSQSAWRRGPPGPLGSDGRCGAGGVFGDCPVIALIHVATARTVATPHPGLRARSL
jgi:hypothetical protein